MSLRNQELTCSLIQITDPAVMNSQNVGEPVLPNDGDGIVEMIIFTASPEGNYGVQPLFDEPELINTM